MKTENAILWAYVVGSMFFALQEENLFYSVGIVLFAHVVGSVATLPMRIRRAEEDVNPESEPKQINGGQLSYRHDDDE